MREKAVQEQRAEDVRQELTERRGRSHDNDDVDDDDVVREERKESQRERGTQERVNEGLAIEIQPKHQIPAFPLLFP